MSTTGPRSQQIKYLGQARVQVSPNFKCIIKMLATYKIKIRELPSNSIDIADPHNVWVTAKNTDTLEEFNTKTYLDPEYLTKVQHWLDKQKYTCEETSPSTLHLTIDELFDFNLERTQRSDAETIRDEIAELKKEKQQLVLEQKLWLNYFYSANPSGSQFLMDERARKLIAQKDYLTEPIVESPKNLYNQCEGLAFVCEEFGSTKRCYIGFKQPLQFLYQTNTNPSTSQELTRAQSASKSGGGGQMMMINTTSQQTQQALPPQDEWFELFISGKGFPHNIALISAKTVKQMHVPVNQFGGRDENGQGEVVTYHLHKINLNLHRNASYTVYTPKVFN